MLLLIYLFLFIYLFLIFFLFIYFWLCWVFVSVRGLSLVAASGGHSSSRCAGLSLSRPLLLRSTGSRHAGAVVVAHGPSAPRHVGSSQTRARTRVPCIGRRILSHCATREAQYIILDEWLEKALCGMPRSRLCEVWRKNGPGRGKDEPPWHVEETGRKLVSRARGSV